MGAGKEDTEELYVSNGQGISLDDLTALRAEEESSRQDRLVALYRKRMRDDDIELSLDNEERLIEYLASEPEVCPEFEQGYRDAIFKESLSREEEQYYNECLSMPYEKLENRYNRVSHITQSMSWSVNSSDALWDAKRENEIVRIARDEVAQINKQGKKALKQANKIRMEAGKPLYYVEIKPQQLIIPILGFKEDTLRKLWEWLIQYHYISRDQSFNKFEKAWHGVGIIDWKGPKCSLAVFIDSIPVSNKDNYGKWPTVLGIYSLKRGSAKYLQQSIKKKTSKKHRERFDQIWKMATEIPEHQ
ncbi:hypothetical protein [Endozoicomonas sp. ALB115]|uniref:hypothetical protein n=1 Tax=Endozoicomonas sp. ALB115 TaxID=3403074 RepID=UPI003BB59C5C